MQKLIAFTLLLCCAQFVHAAAPRDAAPNAELPHPLSASWSWSLPGKQCTESLQYLPGGTSTGRSGAQQIQSRYEVSALPSLLGFYRLAETVTESNNQPDCAGDVLEVSDEPVVRFIQFSPGRNQLIVCRTEALKECYGPLKRISP
ncbi:MAG: hypothetical protein JWR74_543 [Polaromonas sp.]|nr:hypothetical protein [Polaromonas sp.]